MALWQGANRGLQFGLQVYDRLDRAAQQEKADAERTDERNYRRGRDAAGDARAAAEAERQSGRDLLELSKGEQETARNVALAGYNGELSPEQAAQGEAAGKRATAMRSEAVRKLGYKDFADLGQKAAARVDKGEPLENLTPDEVAGIFAYNTGRDPTDFLDRGDQPAPIKVAIGDIYNGIENDDPESLTSGVNYALRPEIEQGVGSKLPSGETIVDKFVTSISSDGKKGRAQLLVKVRDDKGNEREYEAPITKDRKIGGDVAEFDVDRVMAERIQPYEKLAEMANDPKTGPVIRKKLEEWAAAGGEEARQKYRAEYIIRGGDPSKVEDKQTRERVDLGDNILERTLDKNGRVTKEQTLKKGAAPMSDVDRRYKEAQINWRNGAGGAGGAGGRRGGGKNGDLFIADLETGEWMPYSGGEPPAGYSPPFKAGQKPTDIAPETKREAIDKVWEEMKAKDAAILKRWTRGPKPEPSTYEQAVSEAARRERLLNPPPPAPPTGATNPASRQTVAPLRTPGASPIPDGATATNPKTGQKLQRVNGQWVPMK